MPELSEADAAAIASVRVALTDATARLREAGARTEALAEYVPAARVMLVPRAERLRPIGAVWRLGVLLLSTSEDESRQPLVYGTGSITRSHEPGRPTYQAASAERRRQLRVAAYRGRFAEGETVNFDARPIAIDASLVEASGAITVESGRALVRWSAADPGAVTDFDAYLADRVGLLAEPPAGA